MLPLMMSVIVGLAVLAIAAIFVGVLAALLVALGKRRWLWAVPMLVLGPFVALPYALVDADASYARRLLLIGLALAAPAAVLFGITGILYGPE